MDKDALFMGVAMAMIVAPLFAAGFFGVIVGFVARGVVIRRRQRLSVCPGCAQVAGRYPVCAECLDRLHGR